MQESNTQYGEDTWWFNSKRFDPWSQVLEVMSLWSCRRKRHSKADIRPCISHVVGLVLPAPIRYRIELYLVIYCLNVLAVRICYVVSMFEERWADGKEGWNGEMLRGS